MYQCQITLNCSIMCSDLDNVSDHLVVRLYMKLVVRMVADTGCSVSSHVIPKRPAKWKHSEFQKTYAVKVARNLQHVFYIFQQIIFPKKMPLLT